MDGKSKQLSNPTSTGGAGVNFETSVQAAFTVSLLTRSAIPFFPDSIITSIKLQGKYDGYQTDDFILFTKGKVNGNERKLLGQIKHSINITENNNLFEEVIQAAWNDYNNESVFNKESDIIALITGPLSANDIKNTRTILEWARYSENEKEFIKKVKLEKFSNKEKRNKLRAFRVNLKKANNGVEVSDNQLWAFMKSFYLIGYDLDAEGANTLNFIYSLFSSIGINDPSGSWNNILTFVQTVNKNAGTIIEDNIPNHIKKLFASCDRFEWFTDEKKLIDHSNFILRGINNDIGGVCVKREHLLENLFEISEDNNFIFITGERGSGKSSLIKDFVNIMKSRVPIYCFRAEDFDKSHLDQVFTAIGLNGSISDIAKTMGLVPKKYLIIESLEKVLELQHTSAFTDLLQFIKSSGDWTIIASGRNYAYQQIVFSFLQPAGMSIAPMLIEGFNKEQVEFVLERLESLKTLLNNEVIKKLITNPYIMNLAYLVIQTGVTFSPEDTERDFQSAVWNHVISKESSRFNGMPLKRKNTFIDIAVRRAKSMVYGLPYETLDMEVVYKLEEDDLVIRNENKGIVSLAHDVLEDWALIMYIDRQYLQCEGNISSFLTAIGQEPAINRAFRLWLQQKLRFAEDIKEVILDIIFKENLTHTWKDEVLTAILLSDESSSFLQMLKVQLLGEECNLLKRLCFILRISCETPDVDFNNLFEAEKISINPLARIMNLKPYGDGWNSVINFIYENKEQVLQYMLPHVLEVLKEWSKILHIDKELPIVSKQVGLLAIYIFEQIKDSYQFKNERKSVLSILIRVSSVIQDEFIFILERDLLKEGIRSKRNFYIKDLLEMFLLGVETAYMCKYMPDILVKIAHQDWLSNKEDKEDKHFLSFEIKDDFGLNSYSTASGFFPASGRKGPFSYLLKYHPKKGLDFIIDLINYTSERYATSRINSAKIKNEETGINIIKIQLADGSIVEQICSAQLWLGYRGLSTVPDLLQSALMCLENFLILYAEHGKREDKEWLFNYILEKSKSVALTSVLASIATGYAKDFGKLALPILGVSVFYNFEIERYVQESSTIGLNFLNPFMLSNPLEKLNFEERRLSNSRSWRKQRLEELLVHLQFTELRQDIFSILERFKTESLSNQSIRFLLKRVDSRNWEHEVDSENNQIIFTPKELEPELELIQNATQAQTELHNRFSSLLVWSEKTINQEESKTEIYKDFNSALLEVKSLLGIMMKNEKNVLPSMYIGSIVKACVIFLRDNLESMTEDDIDWCIEIVVNSINKTANNVSVVEDNADIAGTGAAVSILPKLISVVKEHERNRIKELIILAITHPSKTVRIAVSHGIRDRLWSIDYSFAEKCLECSLEFSKLQREKFRIWKDFKIKLENKEKKYLKVIQSLRKSILSKEQKIEINNILIETHSSFDLLAPCLMIPNGTKDKKHIDILTQIFNLIAKQEELEYLSSQNERENFDHTLSFDFAKRIAEFCCFTDKSGREFLLPFLVIGCENAPEFISHTLLNLNYLCDQTKNKSLYWKICEDLSVALLDIVKSIHYQEKYYNPKQDKQIKLIRNVLHADTPWQKIDYENQDISFGKDFIFNFSNKAGTNLDVFESMSSLMFNFPNIFLKEGLEILSEKVIESKGINLFSRKNTVFYLENAVQKFLLEENSGIISRKMHRSCLILLNGIVEAASSKGYYLREYLIKSKRINQGL